MIDPKKHYRTRDGREVRIYAVDGGDGTIVHGAIKRDNIWSQACWNRSGGVSDYTETDYDLIEVKPRIKRKVWVNVYTGYQHSFSSKHDAECGKHRARIACVEIDIDVEEGHGL